MGEKEVWRTIPGFPEYEASTLWKVRRVKTGHILMPVAGMTVQYQIRRDGKVKTVLLENVMKWTFPDYF